jgi:3-oxoacyl-[acyl-carrier-protein] synthase-3
MLGIYKIETYIPEKKTSNYEKKERFQITDDFIENKLGVKSVSRIDSEQNASDLCCLAFDKLTEHSSDLDPTKIDIVVVCTQNPDFNLPHTSAIVHGKLNLPDKCAAFDVSLGCSGYVYTLAVIESLMKSSDMKNGLLFTADPYSKIIDDNDKNTALLFGDAATVTHIGEDPVFVSGKFTYGTKGKDYEHLICHNNILTMNGREIFNFAARTVPEDVRKVLEINNLSIDDIDRFVLHQGSKYMIDFLIKRIGLPEEKTPYVIEDYGNTVSSSIPIMLKDLLYDDNIKRVLISGFGVGLSWSSTVLTRYPLGG